MNFTASLTPPSAMNRAANVLKTGVLLAALSALVLWLGQRFGGGPGLMAALALVAVMNFGSYWLSDRIALAMNGARELHPSEFPWLHELLAQIARQARLPTPRLYLVDSPTPNAFATGRSPRHAAVAVTTGLLHALDRRELAGVLAHEVSHVMNRDTLIMTVAATLAGVLTHLAQMALFWGGGLLGGRNDEDESGSSFASLGLLLVAPLAATLLQLAISRSREFDADAAAADLTQDPEGLARALARLEEGNAVFPMDRSVATAHLFIVNPLSGGGVMGLFATHPPIHDRIQRLLRLAR